LVEKSDLIWSIEVFISVKGLENVTIFGNVVSNAVPVMLSTVLQNIGITILLDLLR